MSCFMDQSIRMLVFVNNVFRKWLQSTSRLHKNNEQSEVGEPGGTSASGLLSYSQEFVSLADQPLARQRGLSFLSHWSQAYRFRLELSLHGGRRVWGGGGGGIILGGSVFIGRMEPRDDAAKMLWITLTVFNSRREKQTLEVTHFTAAPVAGRSTAP